MPLGLCHRRKLGFCRLDVETAVFNCTIIFLVELSGHFGLFDICWVGCLGNCVLDRVPKCTEMERNVS